MFYELTTVVPRGSGFRYQSIHVLGLWDDYAYILLYGGNTADSFMKEALTQDFTVNCCFSPCVSMRNTK